MKQGKKSLLELAQSMTHIKENAKDYIVPVERLTAKVEKTESNEKGALVLSFKNGKDHDLKLNDWSKGQLASYAEIPKAYFDRIATENPSLAADNVNHGLTRMAKTRADGKPEARLLRTIDGNLRGLMSSRYRILDSYDLLETVLPIAQEKGLRVVSSEITDRRMYIKLLSDSLTTDVKKGDTVQYGLTISTSDVGAGSVRVEPLIYRLVCANGMISNTAVRKYHVGKSQGDFDVQEILSDRTKEVSDAAFWLQVKDIVLASMNPENFEREVNRLREAANLEIKNFDLPEVVELTMRSVGLTGEAKKHSILAALASGNEGAGLTQWGLINSFTRAAQDDRFNFEESIEMERAAGQILELPKRDWQRIADAVAV